MLPRLYGCGWPEKRGQSYRFPLLFGISPHQCKIPPNSIVRTTVTHNFVYFRTRYDLQAQYQLTENVTATRFILRLSIFTIVCYVVLFSATLSIRLLKDAAFLRDQFPLFQGLRNITYVNFTPLNWQLFVLFGSFEPNSTVLFQVLPLFTLFLPLISEVLRNSDKKREQHKRESIVEQSTVRDPGSVYSSQLERQWKTGAVPVIKFPQRSVSVAY